MTGAMTPRGQSVRLRPLEERDIPLLVRWSNDGDVRHWLHRSERPPETMGSERERYERLRQDPSHLEWCVETVEGEPIGVVRLLGVDVPHGRAELGVVIGEAKHWGRGHGTDAIRQVLRYAFVEMGLRRVYLITDEDNARGIRCYEKCGFAREGLLRAHRLRHGAPLNMVAMGALREDWEKQPWS